MQALDNFENEIKKAFDKVNRDMERHKGIFARLEADLDAVKGFAEEELGQLDFTEALANVRRLDSELYTAIYNAYEREQFEGNTDKHCQGMIAAVNAIYNLGFSNGFKQGAEAAGKGMK